MQEALNASAPSTTDDGWHVHVVTPILLPLDVRLLPPGSGTLVSPDDASVPEEVRERVKRFVEKASRMAEDVMRDGVPDNPNSVYSVLFNMSHLQA